ncbi:MAG: transcription antitermination factor NusB [Bacteroidetes bacterium]|nr:transcription antitermination factor NusB [Bacteroidota bacterium]
MHSSRRVSRIKVLQVLYAHVISQDPIEKVKNDLLGEIKEEDKIEFASELIDKVLKNSAKLDKMIKDKIENWEFERIALVDKLILRMGLSEILHFPEIPPKVSINEAIEIAKEYCTKSSGKFVNGILDAILTDLKNENKLNKSGRGLLDLKKKSNEK